jgi:hypothetical protein
MSLDFFSAGCYIAVVKPALTETDAHETGREGHAC